MLLVEKEVWSRVQAIDQQAGRDQPRGYNHVIRNVSERLYASAPGHLLSPAVHPERSVAIAYTPGLEVLRFAAFRNTPLIFLCWGIPGRPGLRGAVGLRILKEILRRAAVVAVNEPVTADDVMRLSKKRSLIIPYVVDTDFFSYAEPAQRQPFILVPGDNGRDEALVAKLSRGGINVVRVTRDPNTAELHRKLGSAAKVEVNVPWRELRSYYQRSAAVFLPISAPHHPAGQTALLEALACGARIVISKGRAAEALPKAASVQQVDLSDTHEIAKLLRNHIETRAIVSEAEHADRKSLRQKYSFEACVNSFISCISHLREFQRDSCPAQ